MPNRAFHIERLGTPAVICYQRLPKREIITDPNILEELGGM